MKRELIRSRVRDCQRRRKCAHGATVGQLEEENYFSSFARLNYLARNLLPMFCEEIVNKLELTIKNIGLSVLNR